MLRINMAESAPTLNQETDEEHNQGEIMTDVGRNQGDIMTGTIKAWVIEKGYGFLIADDGGPDLFIHQSAVSTIAQQGFRAVKPGTRVQVTYALDKDGKPCASPCCAIDGGELPSYRSRLEAEQAFALLEKPTFMLAPFEQHIQTAPIIIPQYAGVTLRIEPGKAVQVVQPQPTTNFQGLPPNPHPQEIKTRHEGQIITGICKAWYPDKGYGFVIADDGQGDIFVHQTAVHIMDAIAFKCVLPGTRIELEYKLDKGKPGCSRVSGLRGSFLPSFPTKESALHALEAMANGLSLPATLAQFALGFQKPVLGQQPSMHHGVNHHGMDHNLGHTLTNNMGHDVNIGHNNNFNPGMNHNSLGYAGGIGHSGGMGVGNVIGVGGGMGAGGGIGIAGAMPVSGGVGIGAVMGTGGGMAGGCGIGTGGGLGVGGGMGSSAPATVPVSGGLTSYEPYSAGRKRKMNGNSEYGVKLQRQTFAYEW